MPATSASRPDFIAAQYAFAGHLRDPERQPAPADVDERRMAVYRELIFNNIDSFLSDNFPVLRAITPDEDWLALCRDFLIRHRAQSPYFTDIGDEFLQYLQQEREPTPSDPPFLLELAHYEHIELALSIAADPERPRGLNPNGDLMNECPVVSALASPLAYRFPVHRIAPEFMPESAPEQATFLLVYRDPDDKVHFIETSAASARLLELLKENPKETGLSVLHRLSTEMRHPEPERIIAFGAGQLAELRERHIILGTLPA